MPTKQSGGTVTKGAPATYSEAVSTSIVKKSLVPVIFHLIFG